MILGIGNFYDNIRPEAPGCKTAPDPPRQMLFPIRGRCCFFGKAAEPPRQIISKCLRFVVLVESHQNVHDRCHFQVLAICRACGIAPEQPRQMHFQALAIGVCSWNRTRTTTTDAFPICAPRGGSWHLGKCARTHTTDTFSACAPRMQCVVLRVDDQKLYDRSISHMMCVWCKGYCRPGSAPALSQYCVLENTQEEGGRKLQRGCPA